MHLKKNREFDDSNKIRFCVVEHREVWKETLATSTILLGVIDDVWIILARGKFSSCYSTTRVEMAWVFAPKDKSR